MKVTAKFCDECGAPKQQAAPPATGSASAMTPAVMMPQPAVLGAVTEDWEHSESSI